MNLLAKIQNKLTKGSEGNKTSDPVQKNIKELGKLNDEDKLKVLEYLQSVKNLNLNEQ